MVKMESLKELAARAYNSFAEGSGSKERDFECGQANSTSGF